MHPHSYVLHTFDNSGRILSDVSGSIDAFDSLQVPASVLFSGEPVSHFTMTEEGGETFLTACVAYQASSGRSSPAQGFYTGPMLDNLFGWGQNRKTGDVLYWKISVVSYRE
jgi:hypothetical protein